MSSITFNTGTVSGTCESVEELAAILAILQPKADLATVEPQPKADGRNLEARAHCYEARMSRRSSTKMGGLTKQERSDLYAANPHLATMSKTARAKAWEAIVVEYKAAN